MSPECLMGPNLAGMYELSQTDCAKIVVWSKSGFWQIWNSLETLWIFLQICSGGIPNFGSTVWAQSGWSISRLPPDTLQNEHSQKCTSGSCKKSMNFTTWFLKDWFFWLYFIWCHVGSNHARPLLIICKTRSNKIGSIRFALSTWPLTYPVSVAIFNRSLLDFPL